MRIDQIEWQPIVSCSVDTRVSTVRTLLNRQGADGLLLTDGGLVMGCVDRDQLRMLGLDVVGARDRDAIGPYAHSSSTSLSSDVDVQAAITQMRARNTPWLPVKEMGKLVGMVSTAQLEASRA